MQENEELNAAATKSQKRTRAASQPEGASAQASATSNKKQAFMYLGPNVPGGILFNGSIFKGELPAHLNATFEKLSEIKELFVEIKDVPAFKNELKRQGSEAYRLRQNVERLISEGALRDGV